MDFFLFSFFFFFWSGRSWGGEQTREELVSAGGKPKMFADGTNRCAIYVDASLVKEGGNVAELVFA